MDSILHRTLLEKVITKQPKRRNKYRAMMRLEDSGIFWKEDQLCWILKIPMGRRNKQNINSASIKNRTNNLFF